MFLFCDLLVISFSISLICFRIKLVVFSSSGNELFLSSFPFVVEHFSSLSLFAEVSDEESIPFDLA